MVVTVCGHSLALFGPPSLRLRFCFFEPRPPPFFQAKPFSYAATSLQQNQLICFGKLPQSMNKPSTISTDRFCEACDEPG